MSQVQIFDGKQPRSVKPSRQMLTQYLKAGHTCFLAHAVQETAMSLINKSRIK
jgi:hypothetical protein